MVIRRFRPLDGESISKRENGKILKWIFLTRFRPLDGESISKLAIFGLTYETILGFRPLDGESISKL